MIRATCRSRRRTSARCGPFRENRPQRQDRGSGGRTSSWQDSRIETPTSPNAPQPMWAPANELTSSTMPLAAIAAAPRTPSSGRLEENLDSAAELLTVFREPAGGGKAHGRMTVMTAGMREAGIDRTIVAGIGLMSRIVAFFDGEAVDVNTDAGHGARTARIENGHGARVAAQVSEEVGRVRRAQAPAF